MSSEPIYQLTVSPDFTPSHISGWYIFNTWLQRCLNARVHCELYDDFESQRQAIVDDRVDLIYANPFDAAMLVREKNFTALAKAMGVTDECVIAVAETSHITCLEDLKPGTRLAKTDDPDINLIGMIMLESVDLSDDSVTPLLVDSYVLVAKALIQNNAEVGFFLKDAFNEFSGAVRKQLRPLVSSEISDIQHMLLASPRLMAHTEPLRQALADMPKHLQGNSVLEALNFTGWQLLEQEDTEFMIDMIDTLKAK
ncbi:MAG: phosphate ABC transporter substrate-binding protein [Halothiobacillus sp. 24-54-40]|jgi:phosphonate transport system substrate-binding protein|nr:MAG: phosphate ABC transporter substrate-binding protein [Halothiobacillus sp. 35-54-62]OYZ87960.1 MAG: phosphate ABC transporter substrate-binding protein [Halothiobacillus sp. 24-54-40]OZA81422.1 MAG: phosphate ABC transporter substrate-binding protein [Halothiobacillus sp. 39-53-45]HQS02169.1 PhnD/SsuA/transferrin family substrate-binding protein [Halothiobacillus sp.]HQS28979.1 PhnD/SsuA/transferrin family substrate-binding protein [Halothiobacillus sp.]